MIKWNNSTPFSHFVLFSWNCVIRKLYIIPRHIDIFMLHILSVLIMIELFLEQHVQFLCLLSFKGTTKFPYKISQPIFELFKKLNSLVHDLLFNWVLVLFPISLHLGCKMRAHFCIYCIFPFLNSSFSIFTSQKNSQILTEYLCRHWSNKVRFRKNLINIKLFNICF